MTDDDLKSLALDFRDQMVGIDLLRAVFQAGAASRDAEVVSLTNQRDYEYVLAENAEHDKLLVKTAAKDAEIESEMSAGQFVLEQLAAEQAKNVELLDTILKVRNGILYHYDSEQVRVGIDAANEALSTTSDTSVLEAIVKKAGEVMRENCIAAAGPEDSYQDDWIRAKIDACDAIRSLPALTLEDLK